MNYKGKLIIIGGAEAKTNYDEKQSTEDFRDEGILKRIVDESKGKTQSRVEIVTTASTVPEEVAKDYIKAFNILGIKNVDALNIETREEAADPKILKRLEQADVVFFSGGDQLRLTSILAGTPFYNLLIQKLKTEEFIYAGTSAGAAVASNTMIVEGSSKDAILKGEVKTTGGFGLVENICFDTHFIHRGRIGRLFQIVVSNPEILGIGLEENTALLIKNNKMEAIGPGMSILIDGKNIRETNLLDIRDGIPLSIENLTLHVMSKTDVYDLKTRKLTIITPEECKR